MNPRMNGPVSAAAPASKSVPESVARMIAGIGGPVGVTVDDRAVAKDAARELGLFPTYRWGLAPSGLATRRQLSACGLRPGGAEPVAGVGWRRGRRFAELYDVAKAKPKRPMTPAKWAALAAAMRARRTCRDCGRDVGYVLPGHARGRCDDCEPEFYGGIPVRHAA